MKKEDEALALATAFENQLKSIRNKFGSEVRKNIKSLDEDLKPLKEEDERREQVEYYKNNLGDALYYAAYDQMETIWTYTNRIADYMKIGKNLDTYDTWEKKEKYKGEVTREFELGIDEMEKMFENLPFY